MCRRLLCLLFLASWWFPATAGEHSAGPPAARVDVVHDQYFGVSVPDPYRWMEAMDSAFHDYLRTQNTYTRKVLDKHEGRQPLLERIQQLQTGADHVRFVWRAGEHFYFLQTPADSTKALLVQRAVAGGPKRVLVEPAQFNAEGRTASVDFISASPNGRYVAFIVSHDGAENWTLRIVDTVSGKLLEDKVPKVANPVPDWSADSQGFYYARLQDLPANAPETEKYDNVRIYFHSLGTSAENDVAVFGPGVTEGFDISGKAAFPDIATSADGRWLVAIHTRGTDYNAKALWVRDLREEAPRWRQVADYSDLVSSVQIHGNAIYVISGRGAPNGQVLRFDAASETLADADIVAPESNIIISGDSGWLSIAKDALYILGQRNGYGVVRRLVYDQKKLTEIALPATGVIIEFATDQRAPGACFGQQSPVMSPRLFCYDPQKNALNDTGLIDRDPADYSGVTVRQVEVESTDGAQVPLTIIGPKQLELDGNNPVLLTVYGSYGAIVPMWFSAPNLAWYERGGLIVFAHTRGGGEKGVAWHEAGRKTRKQNTVNDVLAAANWLIKQGYTSPRHLAIAGKSAGGLPTGAAITQRPELFRAALFRVGVTDMLRIEQSAGGPANAAEYGSIYNEEEFRALLAISPYANVREGVAYPAVMLETGANDPRVPPWQLAKMAARLQSATSSGLPVLLRVDFNTGHGLGTDKRQAAELLADEYTFLGWQLGMTGFSSANQ